MRTPDPTRSSSPPGHPVLVYDGDCPFCRWSARWLARRATPDLELRSFEAVPRDRWLTALTDDEVTASAHYIAPDGIELHAGAALTAALRLTRYAHLATLLDRTPTARDAAYTAIARTRRLWSLLLRA